MTLDERLKLTHCIWHQNNFDFCKACPLKSIKMCDKRTKDIKRAVLEEITALHLKRLQQMVQPIFKPTQRYYVFDEFIADIRKLLGEK